jgi:2-polyprenyl-6-methoxyphenol hydroxylase-like FAD-dependent oxidoreductase
VSVASTNEHVSPSESDIQSGLLVSREGGHPAILTEDAVVQRDKLTVLISGAGIAGATLATLLGRSGHRVTVVERDQGVRSSGNPVDVRGAAYQVADRLGILPRLQDAATKVRVLIFVDAAGRRVASIHTRQSQHRELEVPRTDLTSILLEAGRNDAEFLFDEMITALDPDSDGVNVTFDHAAPRRFDLVVGADGIHSGVRRMAFGRETDFARHLGMYVATAKLGLPLERDDAVIMHNEPGTAVALHPGTGTSGVAFLFRSTVRMDHRNAEAARQLLRETYRNVGWRTPELLAAYCAADDVYFDSVTRIRMNSWSRGRVTLVGDAASCVSLFGDGSSSAIEGASTLASTLSSTLTSSARDIASALARYESTHRTVIRPRQRLVWIASHLLIPQSRLGIAVRDQALRITGRRE